MRFVAAKTVTMNEQQALELIRGTSLRRLPRQGNTEYICSPFKDPTMNIATITNMGTEFKVEFGTTK